MDKTLKASINRKCSNPKDNLPYIRLEYGDSNGNLSFNVMFAIDEWSRLIDACEENTRCVNECKQKSGEVCIIVKYGIALFTVELFDETGQRDENHGCYLEIHVPVAKAITGFTQALHIAQGWSARC